MNQNDAKRLLVHLACIQALADGKKIECRAKTVAGEPPGKWAENFDPSFSAHFDYRVKPEPKVQYANMYVGTDNRSFALYAHYTKESADHAFKAGSKEPCYLVKISLSEGEKPVLEIIDR